MADDSRAVSEVRLVGRLGQNVRERALPSGDVITGFDVVIDRPPRDRVGRTRIDTIACVTTTTAVVKRLGTTDAGAWVEATGVLRRRFWRAGPGLGSAMEVDVRKLTKA